MKAIIAHLAAAALLLTAGAAASAQPVGPGAAALIDSPRDAAHPARNVQLLVPSHGEGMNALIFLAAGAGPKPTMILLHGLPGNERNLDLAQAVRRAGWNVLTFTYRGAWGSPGRFSIAGAVEDSAAALAFLRDPAVAARYSIDPERLVLAGHSMGGLAAALVGARDTGLAGIVLLDGWNAGASGDEIAAHQGDATWRQRFEAGFDDLGHSLQGATAASMTDELLARRAEWNLLAAAPTLARHRLLTVYATYGGVEENRALAEAIHAAGAGDRLTATELASDHSFADHRLALAATVVAWLQALPGSAR